jgi:mono/diheme cytochrome c family protein
MLAAIGAIAAFTLGDPATGTGSPKVSPLERVKTTEKGKLKNPLPLTRENIEEGKALYLEKTCGACHGPGGGGIHCPSLINDAWVYGSDDDTIFRLIASGSDELMKNGYSRGGTEIVAGPMPGFSQNLEDEEQLWKIIAYIRSLYPAGSN